MSALILIAGLVLRQKLLVDKLVLPFPEKMFVILTGGRALLAEVLKSESNSISLPACLVLSGSWLVDADAGRELKG